MPALRSLAALLPLHFLRTAAVRRQRGKWEGPPRADSRLWLPLLISPPLLFAGHHPVPHAWLAGTLLTPQGGGACFTKVMTYDWMSTRRRGGFSAFWERSYKSNRYSGHTSLHAGGPTGPRDAASTQQTCSSGWKTADGLILPGEPQHLGGRREQPQAAGGLAERQRYWTFPLWDRDG